MIVGNGDIAQALKEGQADRGIILYFASGVSNSSEQDNEMFMKERSLLSQYSIYMHAVYFSSLCVYYSDTSYALHKKQMEHIVWGRFVTKTIIRLGNITWGNNPNTIINYFKAEHAAGRTPELQDTYRYLITKEEFIYWMKLIRPGVNDIMNLPGEMVHVKEIWRRVTDGYY